MAIDPEFESYLKELLEPLGGITTRRMFGGLGIFRHGLMFALYSSQGVFALKADDETIGEFRAEGCSEWQPEMPGRKPVSMGYWQAPERLLEDADEMLIWAEKAFSAAARIDAKKPPSQRKLKI